MRRFRALFLASCVLAGRALLHRPGSPGVAGSAKKPSGTAPVQQQEARVPQVPQVPQVSQVPQVRQLQQLRQGARASFSTVVLGSEMPYYMERSFYDMKTWVQKSKFMNVTFLGEDKFDIPAAAGPDAASRIAFAPTECGSDDDAQGMCCRTIAGIEAGLKRSAAADWIVTTTYDIFVQEDGLNKLLLQHDQVKHKDTYIGQSSLASSGKERNISHAGGRARIFSRSLAEKLVRSKAEFLASCSQHDVDLGVFIHDKFKVDLTHSPTILQNLRFYRAENAARARKCDTDLAPQDDGTKYPMMPQPFSDLAMLRGDYTVLFRQLAHYEVGHNTSKLTAYLKPDGKSMITNLGRGFYELAVCDNS